MIIIQIIFVYILFKRDTKIAMKYSEKNEFIKEI